MTASSPGRWRRGLVTLAATAVVIMAAAALVFWRFPLRTFELIGRAGLRSAGLQRQERAGPDGPLVYWSGGSGPTVIFVHGVNDQAGAWARIVKPLAAGHRVVAVDLPGHGESAPRTGPLRARQILAGLQGLVATEAATAPVTLVGNSMGGWMSMLAAHSAPQQVRHVILVNGAVLRAPSRVSLLPRTREEARASMDAVTGPGAPRAADFVLDDLVRRAPGSALARMIATGDPEDGLSLERQLESFPVPVTLLWGDADDLLPWAYAERVAAALPASDLQRLAGCGHMPQRECADRLVPLLERAIARPAAKRAPPPRADGGS